MKHLMKHIAMVAVVVAVAVGGYMVYQNYCGHKVEVKTQFLNFGGNYDGDYEGVHHHNSSYEAGYRAGLADGEAESSMN